MRRIFSCPIATRPVTGYAVPPVQCFSPVRLAGEVSDFAFLSEAE
jgi:hypothetical protein